jgi:nitrate reductase beta subunit
MLDEADCTAAEAEAIYRLTSLCRATDRFVLPPARRETAVQATEAPIEHKQSAGFGFLVKPGAS